MLRIFIGYDAREQLAYDVCINSILRRTKSDILVKSVNLTELQAMGLYRRPLDNRDGQLWDIISDAPMSTEFAVSRFLVPFLGKEGWVLWMDCDMVCLADIQELFNLCDDKYAVMCVKHNHIPSEEQKFHDGGMIQTTYPRKNWSSLVLWNCDHPANKRLTVDDVNTWKGLHLHGFNWLSEEEIGELPVAWNFLVGVNEGNLEEQKMLHYTDGSPAWGDKWQPKETDYVFNSELQFLK